MVFSISSHEVAEKLKISPSTFNRLIKRENNIYPEMALRLSKTLGRSPEGWLLMQDVHDLWRAKKNTNLREAEKLNINAA